MYRTLLLLLLAGFWSCNSETPEAAETQAEPRVSSTYVPSTFAQDDRRQQIESIRMKLHQLFADYAKDRNIPGIAYGVVVDDELVIDSAVGVINREQEIAATTESSFRIASMTKSFTAMAIMKLMEDGRIALGDPVADYIPEMSELVYPTNDAPVITIENLLTMTAGFPEDNPWGDRQLDEPDSMLTNLILSGISFSNPPGFAFEYSNTGYAILGMIVSRVSGMPYQEYITTRILQPLGMSETYWEYEAVPAEQLAIGYRPESLEIEPMLHDGAFGAMGGLITSISDFSKYVSFHLSAWPPRTAADDGPVKRSSLRKMHQPQFVRLIPNATDWNDVPCPVLSGYGFGLGISENCAGTRRISHGGALPGFGSNYVFYPDLGIGIMAFCNLTYTTPWPYPEILKLLFDELDLQPRQVGTADILTTRRDQIVEMITSWDAGLEQQILAENFYLDEPRDPRMEKINALLTEAGPIQSVSDVRAINQLRGAFDLNAERDTLRVFFTLSPEADPKVQRLNVNR
ncbi:serine hydrolase domain-containing protein [Flavilitoribacter nigricans]|uniref:Serine hydrolase n=1 Tax=Flavilitoribacter nigricans (strain ATCC 23147 / DSM 23189 / NBRC 102662 / NCIMB 1420 / SS-2) TaxID=1122177 RepID=A0A2D0NA18_FLAN2|nr:serine hydrolase domain-containing protein [Flavilitoribacter nigricans]PHN05210.1 serine hydrolase [Flavilitoribacter nigricans DSM 23189 = NBRC 102662]